MRKSVVDKESSATNSLEQPVAWLDIESLSSVQITSEDPGFPFENALKDGSSGGWRAAAKGPQLLRLNFDTPTDIRRIHVHFVETGRERSQEFAIYAATGLSGMREILRQQFTFSPQGATEQKENYSVDLPGVTSFELRIDPDRAHDPAHSQSFATLQSLRLA